MRKFFQSTFPLTHSTFGLLLIAGTWRRVHGNYSRLGGELLKRFVSDQKDNSLTEKKCSKRQCESLLNETLFFHPRFSHCSLSPPFRSLFQRNYNSTIYPSWVDMVGTLSRNWVTLPNFVAAKFRRRFFLKIHTYSENKKHQTVWTQNVVSLAEMCTGFSLKSFSEQFSISADFL